MRKGGAFMAHLSCRFTGVAQLVEQWSPTPKVESSNLSARAKEVLKTIEYLNKKSGKNYYILGRNG